MNVSGGWPLQASVECNSAIVTTESWPVGHCLLEPGRLMGQGLT